MTDLDLFGEPIAPPPPLTAGGKKKRDETPKGYAAKPGTGPAGKTCRNCQHYTHVRSGAGVYRKCKLMEFRWSACYATDIRAGSPACSRFEEPAAP